MSLVIKDYKHLFVVIKEQTQESFESLMGRLDYLANYGQPPHPDTRVVLTPDRDGFNISWERRKHYDDVGTTMRGTYRWEQWMNGGLVRHKREDKDEWSCHT